MKKQLNDKDIDLMYKCLDRYIQSSNNVFDLDDLTLDQQHDWIKELDLLKKLQDI